MRCFNNILEDFFYGYALFLVRHVYLVLLTPIILTAIFSTGFYFIESSNWNDTITILSPKNGRSVFERATFDQQFPLDQENFIPGQSFSVKHFFYLIITGKGDNFTNLLNEDVLNEIDDLNEFILNDLSVDSYDGLYKINYRKICLKNELATCFQNEHLQLLKNRGWLETLGETLKYPISRLSGDIVINLSHSLGSVVVKDDGTLKEVGALRLVYFTKQWPVEDNFYSIQFRDRLSEYLLNDYKGNFTEIAFVNEESITHGLQDNIISQLPTISVSVGLVLFFCGLCSFMSYQSPDGTYIDWVRSKPLLAVVGTAEPCLAVFSAIGLLLLCGCPFHASIIIMGFLVFAIGVDDMFIMISSWHNTRFSDPPEKRFAEAISEAAVAISVTSFSDIIAFTVGIWNPLPAMQMFCYYTAVAMFFELVYQCTFYAAALYLIGRAECQSRHCLTMRKLKPLGKHGMGSRYQYTY